MTPTKQDDALAALLAHLERAKILTGDAYLGADMNKECDAAYSEICMALKLIDGIVSGADDGVCLTDDEWEDMVNQQECLNAEIADCNNQVASLMEQNEKFKDVLDKLLYYAETSNGCQYGSVLASLIEGMIKDVYWK